MNTSKYTVSGMTCGGCVARVKATLAGFAEQAEVTLDPPQATLTGSHADIETLNKALAGVGHYQLGTLSEPGNSIHSSASNSTNNSIVNEEPAKSWFATYYPLLLIFGFITLVTLAIQLANDDVPFDARHWMMHFMAGFFLVFSFFKLLDVRSFADSYAMYDLLAMRFKPYGYIYPFIELGLGFAYLLAWQPTLTNWLTFIVMTFSSLGVIRSVLNKQKIRCACLGAVFNLPMSTVTIIEDLLMAGMALWMLVF
ncbi:MAG TPA: heavy metal-associated domain-containing protein [Methylotenera sp.]|nr:heavy metal-associated domain-containing protein [Methylotenera sp.]